MIDYISETKKYGSQAKAAKALGINKRTFERGLARQKKSGFTTHKNESKLVRFFVMSDSHDEPSLPKNRFAWMGHWAKIGNFDYIVHTGDVADMESLCTHVGNETYNGRFKGTIMDDLASLKQALDVFNHASGGKPVKGVFGNHDWRPWFFANKNPELYGFIQHAFKEIFEKAGWDMLDYGARLTLEGVDFIHCPMQKGSDKKPMGGETLMQRYAKRITRPVCFGHNHMEGVYTEHKDSGNGEKVTIINLPCSLPQGHLPAYTKGAPTGWSYGAYEITSKDGVIIGHRLVSMLELEEQYNRDMRGKHEKTKGRKP